MAIGQRIFGSTALATPELEADCQGGLRPLHLSLAELCCATLSMGFGFDKRRIWSRLAVARYIFGPSRQYLDWGAHLSSGSSLVDTKAGVLEGVLIRSDPTMEG